MMFVSLVAMRIGVMDMERATLIHLALVNIILMGIDVISVRVGFMVKVALLLARALRLVSGLGLAIPTLDLVFVKMVLSVPIARFSLM